LGAFSIQQQITDTANSLGVNPALALAIANRESNFNQAAVGTSGEIGVFQIMPGTAQQLGVNPSDLSQNITGGITYLKQMLDMFGGNTAQAVAAYNAGPGAVSSGRIPASTQGYVADILKAIGGSGAAGVPQQAPPSAGASPPTPLPMLAPGVLLPSVDSGTVGEVSGLAIAIAALALLIFAA
jgi:soluble lytic murein transglycosylase-like protein